MNKKIFIILFIGGCLLPLLAFSQKSASSAKTITLTVKKIALTSPSGRYELKDFKLTDEKGRSITFSKDADTWFENATLENLTIPKGTSLTLSTDDAGKIQFIPSDDARLLFEFKVKDNVYPIGIGVGSKLVVRKNSAGKYTLLPKETAKLSPPPATEET